MEIEGFSEEFLSVHLILNKKRENNNQNEIENKQIQAFINKSEYCLFEYLYLSNNHKKLPDP